MKKLFLSITFLVTHLSVFAGLDIKVYSHLTTPNISAGGAKVDYHLTIFNNSADPITVKYWQILSFPENIIQKPIGHSQDITLEAFATKSAKQTLDINPQDANGLYKLSLFVEKSDLSILIDKFTFTKGPIVPPTPTPSPAPTDEQRGIRLNANFNNTLEVFHNNQWRGVCDDNFTVEVAKVACRQLGFGEVASPSFIKELRGASNDFWLDELACSGNETSLDSCRHNPYGEENCDRDEHVSVTCR